MKGYFTEFENAFLWLMTYFFCYHKRHSIIQNLFQKLSIFKTESSSSEIWDCQWHKIFSETPAFTALIFLLLFQIIKICQCCGFTFTNFFIFLMATKQQCKRIKNLEFFLAKTQVLKETCRDWVSKLNSRLSLLPFTGWRKVLG